MAFLLAAFFGDRLVVALRALVDLAAFLGDFRDVAFLIAISVAPQVRAPVFGCVALPLGTLRGEAAFKPR